MSAPILDTPVNSFPLERPSLASRRRERPVVESILPYYIAGSENRLAAFVSQSDRAVFEFGNPLLLVGPTGTGKTAIALHLAAREATAMAEQQGPAKISYLPASDFARRFAEAIDADDLPPLREELDRAAVLVIDDLHRINTKPAAQEELAGRIESRTEAGRPTVLTSRRLPSEVRGMRPLLISRALPGLTIPLQPPGHEARELLLRELAMAQSLEIDPDLLDLLAAGLRADLPVRSLQAAIKQITLWSRMNDSPPDASAVQAAIDTVGRGNDVSIGAITGAVARYFRLRTAELKSSSRRQRIVRARSLAMMLARRLTTNSLHQIGDHFGGRDHSTVLHAIRKCESLIEQDGDLRRAADEVAEKFSG